MRTAAGIFEQWHFFYLIRACPFTLSLDKPRARMLLRALYSEKKYSWFALDLGALMPWAQGAL